MTAAAHPEPDPPVDSGVPSRPPGAAAPPSGPLGAAAPRAPEMPSTPPGAERSGNPGAGPPVPLSPEPPWPPGGTPAEPWAPEPAEPVRVRLDGPADLVAAIPVLLGFHPEDSLVLVGLAAPEQRGRIGMTVRIDLPPPGAVRPACDEVVSALAGGAPARAAAVIVGGGSGLRRSRRDVAVAARRALRWSGIDPMAVLWASGTRHGDHWSCYRLPGQDCGCFGTVPDPASTPMALAAAVRGGRAVLPDRAAVAAQLDGDRGDRDRRARLRAGTGPASGGVPGDPLPARLREAAEGRLVIDDVIAGDFRSAFGDPGFRDRALRCCLGPQAPHAEQLWAALTRSLPAPDRADPAALLATCAFLRGDGALAALALERARDDRPDHALAAVVARVLRDTLGAVPGHHTGPAGLRRLLTAMLDGDPEQDQEVPW